MTGGLVDPWTDVLATIGPARPHLHVILRRQSRGVTARFVLIRTREAKPPMPLGKLHVSVSLWQTVFAPALMTRVAQHELHLTVDDQGGEALRPEPRHAPEPRYRAAHLPRTRSA